MKNILKIVPVVLLLSLITQVYGQSVPDFLFERQVLQNHFDIKSGMQRTGKFVNDSTYYYRANLFGQMWFNTARYKVTQRDQSGNFLTALNIEYDTLQMNWYESNTYEATYSDSIHPLTWTANVWDLKVGIWRMSDSILYLPAGYPQIAWFKVWNPESFKFLRGKRFSYFYFENGKPEKQFTQDFDTLNRNWRNERQDFYAYNLQNLLQENLVKTWDTLNLLWANSELINLTYNTDNLLVEQLNQEWQSISSLWMNKYKAAFFYTSTNLPGERFVYQWNQETSKWENWQHTTNSYNSASLLTGTTSQYWDSDDKTWINDSRILYYYDAQNNKNQVVYQYWEGFGDWTNLSKYIYNYDGNGNRTGYLFSTWDFENNSWEDFYKEDSYWSEFKPFSVDEFICPLVNIYPNPAGDFVTITFKTEVKDAFYFLCSSNGNILKKQNIHGNSATINTSGILPGTYILRFFVDGQSFSQKIILQ